MLRELTRSVGNDCAVEVDTNSYSVPWRQIGERVAVTVAAGKARVDLALTKFYLGLSSFGRLDVPMRAVVAAGAGAERST
ncbi:Mu transposase domain-containing protein [Bradyrhizobium sp. SZCCHNS3002]|uniref:Mu transposase domain-containing protein n=1 Tax=Bradyrhizobium sp. SZCCHNS3002 TaxID=3057310 RepID=UPI00396588C2